MRRILIALFAFFVFYIPAQAAVVKDWTVMVFINGKNNLAPAALQDVNEMEMIGSTSRVNVVAEVGHINSPRQVTTQSGLIIPSGELILPDDERWNGTHRFYIMKDTNRSAIKSMLFDVSNEDMGDWKRLSDFVVWARLQFPAKRYMLIVWNHGGGVRGISFDDVTGNNIAPYQLGLAFNQMGKIDVYGSDACLMQMAEIGYELKDKVPVIVGSEESEPGDGYNYTYLLDGLNRNPDASNEDVGRMMVAAFMKHYTQTREPVTQSAIRTAPLGRLGQLLSQWTDAVVKSNDINALAQALQRVQRFSYQDSIDLYHFVQGVGYYSKDPAVRSIGAQILTLIKNDIVLANGATRAQYPNANGLAIFFPVTKQLPQGYLGLKMSRDTNWDNFIRWVSSMYK